MSLVLRMRSRLLSLVGVAVLGLLLVLTAPARVSAAMDVAKQVLIGADYSGKDLRGATFNLSNLREANLSGSDLRGASLYGAKLQDADLSGTDLREATLDASVMTGTNLSNAVLEGAFAFNTRFVDVIISGADFTDVPMRGDQLKSLCSVAEGTNPVTGRSTRDSLGCGWSDEFRPPQPGSPARARPDASPSVAGTETASEPEGTAGAPQGGNRGQP